MTENFGPLEDFKSNVVLDIKMLKIHPKFLKLCVSYMKKA
jgi:hypothetical protein